LTNRRSFSGPRKGRNPESDASVLEYFKRLLVTREALMSNAEECVRNNNLPFKAGRGCCEKFMDRESLSL
jgi:hypothetical protein